MQEKYTKEEYKKLVGKGRRFLLEYLEEIGEGFFHDPVTKKRLFSVLADEYKRLMQEDEEFFRAIESFCSQRRHRSEKRTFFKTVMNRMVSSGSVHREYAKRYPEYDVPKRYMQ